MFCVYVLKSKKNGKLYTGYTSDIDRRLLEHNTKNEKKRYACLNGPWELIFSENFETRDKAMKHEKFLKSGKGRELLSKKLGL